MEDIVKIHCNVCGNKTNHKVRCANTVTREDFIKEAGESGITFEEKETFEILQCLGCDEMAVRQSFWHEGYGEGTPRYYPPRISRRTPRWLAQLPKQVRAVVDEVYKALQNNSPRLATIGARTIVDLVILDKVGDIGSFAKKLEALESQGYVGRKNREFVAAALEAGSAAAHRGVAPSISDLNRVMDIVEGLLESVYILEDAATQLRKTTPPRPKLAKNDS